MTELEFFPYHNYHIVFKVKDGKEMSGVLLDPMDSYETGKPATLYTYIPTSSLKSWKLAQNKGDRERMKELQSEIDIKDVTWAMRLNY